MRWILIFFLLTSPLFAQQITLTSEIEAPAMERFIGYDAYNHIYYIENGVLYKEGDLGKFVFQDYQLGPITTVDIINPLNLVVFYAEVNTVVFLDNRLTEKERINFNTLLNFTNISSVTNAGNNRLWMFNMDTQQLQLYDYRTQRATIFSQPYEGKMISQVSDFNDCFLLTDSHLWRVNIYGSLLSEFQVESSEKIVRNGDFAILLKQNELFLIDNEMLTPIAYNFNENPIKDLQLTQEFLYIYRGNMISTFSLTQPKQ